MKNDLEEKYRKVIEDNVNVGERSDGKEFFVLLAGLVGFCLLVFIFADLISNVFIDNMSNKTQCKIENAISFETVSQKTVNSNKIAQLEAIRNRIVRLDKNLQGKSNFPINVINDKSINAFVYPNGTIYFTSELLKEINDEEILTFVLAHELGHYAHRDHLKSISRDIISSTIMTIVTCGQKDMSITVSNISDLTGLKYSRRQEKAADNYANRVVYRIYGRNTGAVKFFKYLQSKENTPEFLYYFSTHPSTKERLNLLQER